ncbi:hypothetical protein MNBD_NITROSPINAE04-2313 [hydrothermal vent metagenome]|uniref:MSHA biogenesis protein MshK n=1 Tax=hydrothermal vent metagenome TaxID=652676 RepID=A0A3B1C5M9_9ZZZZ
MRINHRLIPIYSALAALIILFLSGVGSYAHQDNERDPFRFGSAHFPQPGYETGEDGDGAVLQMILITDRHRIAVFNGRRYQEGDSIGEYTITRIELDKVTLENKEDKKVFAPHRK